MNAVDTISHVRDTHGATNPAHRTRQQARLAAGLLVALAPLVALVVASTSGVGAHSAFADTTVPYEPVGAPSEVGTITFTNASGTPVTSGHLSDSPIAAYAVGSVAAHSGDTKAVLYYKNPVKGVDPANWQGGQMDALTTYSPAPVACRRTWLPSATLAFRWSLVPPATSRSMR